MDRSRDPDEAGAAWESWNDPARDHAPNRLPEAAIDAVVETAWSFPGLRTSFGALRSDRTIDVFTSAGSEKMCDLGGERIDLREAPRLFESLRHADQPVAVEDVSTDTRTRSIASSLRAYDCQAMLLLPLRRGQDPDPFAVVMIDRGTPGTWGDREAAALDRLAPIAALSVDHVDMADHIRAVDASAKANERRIIAIRGVLEAVTADAHRLVHALQGALGPDQTMPKSLVAQLARRIEELDGIQPDLVRSALPNRFNLAAAVREIAPGLEQLTSTTIGVRAAGSVLELQVSAHRSGVERILTNLVVYACRSAARAAECQIDVKREDDGRLALWVYGDAVEVDEALVRTARGRRLDASDPLSPMLWRIRCEALVQGIDLDVAQGKIRMRMPGLATQVRA